MERNENVFVKNRLQKINTIKEEILMKRRFLSVVLSVTMAAGLIAGCGNSNNKSQTEKGDASDASDVVSDAGDAAEEQKESGDKIIVRVTRWGGTEQKAEPELIEEFNKTNDKNIEIVYDLVPGDGYGDRLTTSFSSGDGYDVFLSGEGDFYKWVDMGLTMPMDEIIANDTEYVQELPDVLMNMGRINGEQHYMVGGQNPINLYYNKDMFDAAGVAYPTDDWTWDDLFAAAEQLTVKNDDGSYEQYGFNAQNWPYAVLTYLESLGLNFMNEDGTECDGYMNDPKVAEALDKYFAMCEEPDKVSPAAADLDTFGNATAMMSAGKLAMFVSGGWEMQTLEEAGTNYGIALVPGNHTSYMCAAGFAIGANCKNPEAAWEVVKLLTGAESSQKRYELEGALPIVSNDLESYEAGLDESKKPFVAGIEYGVQPIGMRSKMGSIINEKTQELFENIIFHTSDTQKLLDDVVTEVKSELAE